MTLLTNYRTWVNDEQASSYYKQWARSNPVEAGKWAAFRDGVLAGERPTPPSLATLYGKAKIDATLIYLNAVAPPPPPPAPVFTKTFTAPTGNIDAFLDSLVAGDVAGLGPGGVYTMSSYQRKAHGTAAKPIILTSMDTTKPAIIGGRFVTYLGDPTTPAGNYWTLRYLGLDGSKTTDASSGTIQSTGVRFEQCDMSNFGADRIGWIVQSTATGTVFDRCRIHDCGTINPRGNMEHGVYDEGNQTYMVDCLVYRNADRGIQDRGGHGSIYEYCTLTHNGEGIIFGDDRGAVDCTMRKCILTDQQVAGRYLVEALGNANSGNVVDDVYLYSHAGYALVQPGIASSVQVTSAHLVDPLLDANMMPGLPAAVGYGCRTLPPKILSNA